MKAHIRTIVVLGFLIGMGHSLSANANDEEKGTEKVASASVEALGEVFYKMPAGNIVKREITLVVPMQGKGDVSLKTSTQEIKASKFWTEHAHGKTIFYVAVENPPGAPENTIALFKGSYLRGTNVAVYYGDVYQTVQRGKLKDFLDLMGPGGKKLPKKQKSQIYVGGFFFQAPIKQDQPDKGIKDGKDGQDGTDQPDKDEVEDDDKDGDKWND